MGTRTVRLYDKTEKVLKEVVRKTGLSISDTFKCGILALRDAISDQPSQSPYDVYQKLDLGPGRYSKAPSTQTRQGVQDAIKRKHKR